MYGLAEVPRFHEPPGVTRIPYQSSVAVSRTLRIVTFRAVTLIEPRTSLFSYTWPSLVSVTSPLTAVSAVPDVTPTVSTSG